MDPLDMVARGYRPRRNVAPPVDRANTPRVQGIDTRRWDDSPTVVPTRRPDPGSRTVTRLKRRHFTAGLAHDPEPGYDSPSTVEQANLLADMAANKPAPKRVRFDAPTSADLPDLPEHATPAQVKAWREQLYAMRRMRAAIIEGRA